MTKTQKTIFSEALEKTLTEYKIQAIDICTIARSKYQAKINQSQISDFKNNRKDIRGVSIEAILLAIACINPEALTFFLDEVEEIIINIVKPQKKKVRPIVPDVPSILSRSGIDIVYALTEYMYLENVNEDQLALDTGISEERISQILNGHATEQEIVILQNFLKKSSAKNVLV